MANSNRSAISVRIASTLCILLALGLSACATSSSKKKELSTEERAAIYVQMALGSLKEGDPTGALQTLADAERLDPTNPEVYHTKALALFEKFERDMAVEPARKAVKLVPKNSNYRNTLGKLLLDQGKFAEAEKLLLAAASDQLYRDTFKPNTSLGILYYKQGKLEEANKRLSLAIRDEPNMSCYAYYYRGHIHLKEGRFQKAEQDYKSATQQICASFAEAHLALGIAYQRGKKYSEARKKFLDITTSFPQSKVAEEAMAHLRFLP